jgi:hypothetical protein
VQQAAAAIGTVSRKGEPDESSSVGRAPILTSEKGAWKKNTHTHIRQMPGLCLEPQPRQATHHHHQTLVEDLQNEDRSLTGVGELNPY